MFELESKNKNPIRLIMEIFKENNIKFMYCHNRIKETYSVKYDEIDNEKVLSLLEDIAIKYKL